MWEWVGNGDRAVPLWLLHTRSATTRHGAEGGRTSNWARSYLSCFFVNDNVSHFLHEHHPTFHLPSHTPVTTEQSYPLNMDITGHFESASCVIEVDGSDTLAQVKGKLVAELGVPGARHVGVRMKGGGDIGNDDLRICDTEMDEGCAVELYRTGANMTPGVILRSEGTLFFHTLSV